MSCFLYFPVIYYNIDLKYFKTDMTVHAEPFEDDVDEDDEDKFDSGEGNEEEIMMTRQFLLEMNQRMMSLESEVKLSNSRHNHYSKEDFCTPLSDGMDTSLHSPTKPPGTTYDMGDSFQSAYSVHEFSTTDLDGKGSSTHGRPQAPRYFDNSPVISDMSVGEQLSSVGAGAGAGAGGATTTTTGGGGVPLMSMSMVHTVNSFKRNRKKVKKRGSQYGTLRHAPSMHVMR
jgi:hypothetical protein